MLRISESHFYRHQADKAVVPVLILEQYLTIFSVMKVFQTNTNSNPDIVISEPQS